MSNRHDEIKNLIKASRNMLSNKNSLNETYEIKKQYGLLTEKRISSDDIFSKINVGKTIEKEIESSSNEKDNKDKGYKNEKSVSYRISGGVLKIYGNTKKEIQLTEDEKAAFQETMDEFITEVSKLVDFNELIILPNDVTWSGRLNDYNLEFDYRVNEENGAYFKVDFLSKISDDIIETMKKLQSYYDKFKSKWSEILGNRKMTKTD
jgi:hypothetical protein